MARTNVMQTAKFRDEIVGDGYKTSFEYETLNGQVIGTLKAEIKKNGKTTYVSRAVDGNGQSINGDFHADLITEALEAFDTIVAENTPEVEE